MRDVLYRNILDTNEMCDQPTRSSIDKHTRNVILCIHTNGVSKKIKKIVIERRKNSSRSTRHRVREGLMGRE